MTIKPVQRPTTSPVSLPPVTTSPTLRQGSRGESVRELQQLLAGKGARIGADGQFGPMTRDAVVAFQRSQGLAADGIVGRMTWAALRDGNTRPSDTYGNDTTVTPNPGTTAPVADAAAERARLARGLVRAGGSATQADVDAVARTMQGLPLGVLQAAARTPVRVVACRETVTDYMPELRGVRPRGWPPGSSWDQVPGLYSPSKDEVVAATVAGPTARSRIVPPRGQGHGSYDLVLHELGHGLDDQEALGGRDSGDAAFRRAYEADRAAMERLGMTYLLQSGDAGPSEAFAETFARHFSGDRTLARQLPALAAYWQTAEASLR